jgi:aminomethyltransferase
MARTTVLNGIHRQAGGRMVDFAGFELPLHFGSQIREHHAVRREAGMFDVSHMARFDLEGPGSRDFLLKLLANDIGRLHTGHALYTCLLNNAGGVLDDAMAFYRGGDAFRLVSNAATRDKIAAWLARHGKEFAVAPRLRDDLAMVAVQGPLARMLAGAALPEELRTPAEELPVFGFAERGDWMVARTGYTGEDGYEIMLPEAEAPALWQALAAAGVAPCGLGARDTLRLEAGLRLYGQDMDETSTPLESGLGWTVAFEFESRDFIGRAPLEIQRGSPGLRRFAGLVLEEPGVLRHGQKVTVPGAGEGIVTSGSFAPSLDRSVGFARLPAGSHERCLVDVRGQAKAARITGTRFLAGR